MSYTAARGPLHDNNCNNGQLGKLARSTELEPEAAGAPEEGCELEAASAQEAMGDEAAISAGAVLETTGSPEAGVWGARSGST